MKPKTKAIKPIAIFLVIVVSLCFLSCRYYSFTPERRKTNGTFRPDLSSKAPLSPVVYEGFFPDNTEVRKLFEQQREKPVFRKEPALYHVTTLFYPAENADHLYGTKVKLHVTSYQYERFLDRNFHLTGAEAIKIEIECDNPELQEYLNKINGNWHITRSYMTEEFYTSALNYENGKPLDYTLDATFGAYCTQEKICFDSACLVGLENRFSRES